MEAGKTVRYNVALETAQADLQILDTNGVVISVLSIGNSSRGIFLLKNAGESIVEWEIPKLAVEWIAGFSKQSGKLAPGAVDTVMLTIDRSQLSEGSNEAVLYIGSSVGDKKLLITAGMELSFCFTDSYGNEIMDVDMSYVDQYRFKIKNTGSGALTWSVGEIEGNWLTFVGNRNGQLSAGESESRTLKVDRTRLEEGMHETALIFKTNAGTKSLLVKNNVGLSYQLVNAQGEEISLLDLGQMSQGSFKIKNTGSGILEWEISRIDADWLSISGETKGKLWPKDAATVELAIEDLTKLSVGANEATVYVGSTGGEKQLTVRFEGYADEVGSDYTETAFGMELQMVAVHGGTFLMGATEEQQGNDPYNVDRYATPVHEVMLDGFYIGKYIVTQSQWEAVMGKIDPDQFNAYYNKGDDYPMYVNWYDAQAFCSKLSEQTGKKFRLPTEAEWEYAARGGRNADGTKYAGSNNIDDVAWYVGNGFKQGQPVGQKKPNGLGLYDMSGNGSEWCSDWYQSNYYVDSPCVNPQGPKSGASRVSRGYYNSYDWGCRVSCRNYRSPELRSNDCVMRVVCEP